MAEKTAEEIEQERLAEEARKAEEEKQKKKVKFDAEQTLFVNELYNRAHGQARQKADEEWQARLAAEKKALEDKLAAEAAARAELAKQVEDLKKLQPPVPEPPKAPKLEEINIGDHPAFKALNAQFEEMRGIFTTVKAERDTFKAETQKAAEERARSRKKDLFLSAMKDAKVTFFDPLEAYDLAERDGLEYDAAKDRIFVKNPATGIAKLNENGEDMNGVDFVKDFATRKNYLVKAEKAGGLGNSEAELTNKDKAPVKDWSKASAEDFEKQRQEILSKPRP